MKFEKNMVDSLEPITIDITVEEFEKSYKPHMELGGAYLVSTDGVSTLTPADEEAERYVRKLNIEDMEWMQELSNEGKALKDLFDTLAKPLGGSYDIFQKLKHGESIDLPNGRVFLSTGSSKTLNELNEQKRFSERDRNKGLINRENYHDALGIKGHDNIIGTVGRENIDVVGIETSNQYLLIDRTHEAKSLDDIKNRKLTKKVLVIGSNSGHEGDPWGGDRFFTTPNAMLSTDLEHAKKVHAELSKTNEFDEVGITGSIVAGVGSEEFPIKISYLEATDYIEHNLHMAMLQGTSKSMYHRETDAYRGANEVKSSHIKAIVLDKNQKSMFVQADGEIFEVKQGLYFSKEPSLGRFTSYGQDERVNLKEYRHLDPKRQEDLDYHF